MLVREVTKDARTGKVVERLVEIPGVVSAEEAAAADLVVRAEDARRERTRRLAACDWTTLQDVPLTAPERDAWAAYRVALRGVPEQGGFPDAIQWPEPPGKIEFTPSGGRSL